MGKYPHPPGPRGWVPYADDQGRVGWERWDRATAPGPTGSPRPFKQRPYLIPAFDPLPKLVKRTPQERIESLTKRLVDEWRTNPRIAEVILSEIQTEYWKIGTPVTAEALRRAAGEALRDAERRARR